MFKVANPGARSSGHVALALAVQHAYHTNYWHHVETRPVRVTTAEFIKNYGSLADQALSEPLTITKNGRDRLVLVSVAEYERLKRRDRRAIWAGELTEGEIALIAAADVPAGHEHLDAELADWQP